MEQSWTTVRRHIASAHSAGGCTAAADVARNGNGGPRPSTHGRLLLPPLATCVLHLSRCLSEDATRLLSRRQSYRMHGAPGRARDTHSAAVQRRERRIAGSMRADGRRQPSEHHAHMQTATTAGDSPVRGEHAPGGGWSLPNGTR